MPASYHFDNFVISSILVWSFLNFFLFIACAGSSLRHAGFCCCGAQAVSSPTRDGTHIPCIGRQILNHWTTKEVLSSILSRKEQLASDSDGKESACNAGDPGPIPGLERSPGDGNDYPLQYSCLEKSMNRGASWAPVPGFAKRQTQLSDSKHTHMCSDT